jgi:hypothetical protein
MKLWQAILAGSSGNFVPPSVGLAVKSVMNFSKAEWFLAEDDHDFFKNYLINSLALTTLSGTITLDANGYPTGTGVARITCVPSLMKTGLWHVVWTGTISSVAVSSSLSGAKTVTTVDANRVTFNNAAALGLTIDGDERFFVDLTNPNGLTGLYLVHDDDYVEGTYATAPIKTAIANSINKIAVLRHMDGVRSIDSGYEMAIYQPTGDAYTVSSDGLTVTMTGSSSDLSNLGNAITSRGGIANCVILVTQTQDFGNGYRTVATAYNPTTKVLTLQQPIRTGLTNPAADTYPLEINVFEKRTWANRNKNKDILQVANQAKLDSTLTQIGDGCWHQGYSLALMVAISNQLQSDLWFNIHFTMSSSDIEQVLAYIHANLNAGLKCFLEIGNENWNFSFITYSYYSMRGRQISGTGNGDGSIGGSANDFVTMCNTVSTWVQTNIPSDPGKATLKAGRTGLGRFVRVLAWQQENMANIAEYVVSGEYAGARADVFSTAPYIQVGLNKWDGASTPLLANLTGAPFNTYPDYRRVSVDETGFVYYKLGASYVQWRKSDAITNVEFLADLKLGVDYLMSANAYDEGYLRKDFTYAAEFTNQAAAAIPMPMYQYEGGADYFFYNNVFNVSFARWDTFRESPQFVEFLTYYFEKVKEAHTLFGTPDFAVGYYMLLPEGWGMYADTSKMITSNQVSQFLNTNLVKV